jgi:branched-chain amino acid transport system substrate-binding protein
MRRILLPTLSAILFLSAALSGCSKSPIVIGFSARLTGVSSGIGVDLRNGATFAVETINAKGGIRGRELKLISRDDGASPEEAVNADSQLVKEGAVAIIGHLTSTKTLAVLPFLERIGVPLVAPNAASSQLEGASPILFRMNSSSSRSADALAIYAREEMGCRSIIPVLDRDNEVFASSFSKHFGETFTRRGSRFLEPVWFSSRNLGSWDETAAAASQTDATGILILAASPDAAAFANAVDREYCLFSSGWAYTDDLLRFGGQAVEGMLFADTFSEAILEHQDYHAFEERYLKRFGKLPSFSSSQAYDALLFLSQGLSIAKEKSISLVEALHSIERFEGVYREVELSQTGEALRPVFISTIEDGAFKTVKEIPVRSKRENK